MKYKNKNGIELSYTGNDSHQELVKEVVSEAIYILKDYNPQSILSKDESRFKCIDFLKTNFNIK